MKDLFGDEYEPKEDPKRKSPIPKQNPLHKIYGKKDDTRCKNCIFFIRKKFSNTYFKCQKRGVDGYEKTDHRANWIGCGLYKESKAKQPSKEELIALYNIRNDVKKMLIKQLNK